MVDRGSHDRKTQGDVHRGAERDHLDRDEPLIVVAGDDGIELTPDCSTEHRVTREGANHFDTAGPPRLDRRREYRFFLVTQQTILTRVWVEPGQRQPRARDTEPR